MVYVWFPPLCNEILSSAAEKISSLVVYSSLEMSTECSFCQSSNLEE